MTDMKRAYDEDRGKIQGPSTKFREQITSDGADHLPIASSTAGSTSQEGESLCTLPAEIVHQILHHSREPNLIHTCRSLYQKLPDYGSYVRSMAILAFMPRKMPRKMPWTLTPIPTIDIPVPEIKHFVDLDQLHVEVCRSSWLTPGILRETHITLLQHAVYAIISSPEVSFDPDKREQLEQQFQALRDDYPFFAEYPSFDLSMGPCPGSPFDNAEISVECFQLHLQGNDADEDYTTSSRPAYNSFYFFETSLVPDCVLANPTDATAQAIIMSIAGSYEMRGRISCSRSLMQQAILTMLREPAASAVDAIVTFNQGLRDLCMLNRICKPPAPYTGEMLGVAVHQNKVATLADFLSWLPYNSWSIWELTLDDLLRLQLSLQPHQADCYHLLYAAIKQEFANDVIGQEVAQRLGFEDVAELEAAQDAVRSRVGIAPPDPELHKARYPRDIDAVQVEGRLRFRTRNDGPRAD